MNKVWIYIFLLQVLHVLSNDVVSYKGYSVYRVLQKGKTPKLKLPNSEEKLSVLTEHYEYDKENNPLTVRTYLIPQQREEDFRKVLDKAGARYNVSIEDLDRDIAEEKKSYLESNKRAGPWGWNIAGKYFSYDDMIMFLRDMGSIPNPKNRESLAIIEPIGKSLEGREMVLVKISSDHNARKPVIFIEAGIHAREWTAPSTALYIIQQLVANYTMNAMVLEPIDFYIIPMSNPDGYEYSRTIDRLWRKTRSFHRGYYGVDGNRNFGFHWGEGGTSSNPASEVFKGPFPFSEVETRNIRDAGMRYKNRINVFVSLHAYGPSILYPWSFSTMAVAPQSDIMCKIAKAAADAMRYYSGTEFAYGPSSVMMYLAAGGSDDYFKGVLGVDLAFTFELSSTQRGGFLVPTTKIYDVVSEAFVGIKVIAEHGARYRKMGFGRDTYENAGKQMVFCIVWIPAVVLPLLLLTSYVFINNWPTVFVY